MTRTICDTSDDVCQDCFFFLFLCILTIINLINLQSMYAMVNSARNWCL